ncbi:hypothetical protein NQZ68_009924 [Dissostichus eleginoides]|nr:hypothetical protein NQZ68_009924 [Dissostichus eleginoides]
MFSFLKSIRTESPPQEPPHSSSSQQVPPQRDESVFNVVPPLSSVPLRDVASVGRTTENSIPVPDLSAIDDPAATQPKLIKYPQTLFGQKKRCFAAHWYDKYTFLEYSISKDSVFSKSAAVSKVYTLYDVILEVLSDYSEEGGQSQFDAQSLLQQMRTNIFIFFLVLFRDRFNKSDFATKGLQSISVYVTDSVDLIESLKESLTDMRSGDSAFQKILESTNKLMEDNDIQSLEICLPARSRKLPSRLQGSVVTASLGKSTRVRSDHDLRAILNQLIDCQLNELSARFHNDVYGLMTSTATLLAPSSDSSLTEMTQKLNDAGKRFNISMTELELSLFLQHVARKRARGETFKTLLNLLDICSGEVFPRVNGFLNTLITLPMTSCTA